MSSPTFRSSLINGPSAPRLADTRNSASTLPKPPRIDSGRSSGISLGSSSSSNGNSFASSPGCPGERMINTNTSDFSRTWNVVGDWKSLPRVPPLYVLCKTRTVVRGGGSPADVARRICEALRELSLDAIYDGGRAKAFVTSSDRVEFFIRLFQDNSDLSSRGVIVEFQRKRGCSYRFHRLVRSVSRAACGVASGSAGSSPRGLLRPPTASLIRRASRPAPLGARMGSVPTLPVPMGVDAEHYSLDQALENADDLLRKDRIDANELGMESLVLLTNEESSGADRAMYVSRVLLTDDEKFSDLKKVLMSGIEGSEDEEDDEQHDADIQHIEIMRRHALTVLGNSLGVLARHDCDGLRAILGNHSWIGENGSLLPYLIDELARAETHPHDACEAARCLGAILTAAPDASRCRAKELGAPEKLMVAQGVGKCRHAMLARESDAALVRL